MSRGVFLAAGLLVASVPLAQAAEPESRFGHLEDLANRGQHLKAVLGARHERLSSGGHRIIDLADRWSELAPGFQRALEATSNRLAPVSDPNAGEDFISRMAGNTQSETTLGWCGHNVVNGWNDSGSFVATLLLVGGSPSESFSFDGFGTSSNAGATFTDGGILVADPLPAGILFRDLFGDPLVRCTDQHTFYYGSLATDTTTSFATFSGISVSKSTDAGASWGGAVMAASKSGLEHFLDKPWMEAHGNTIYVTYTDFDFSGTSAACPLDFRNAIELVTSVDGGATWSSPPVIIDEVCGDLGVQGSQIAIGPTGHVHVAWETYDVDFVTRSLKVAKSTTGGASFDPAVTVDSLTAVGAFSAGRSLLQGRFRADLDLGGLAVDRSGGPGNGNLYIVWQDGRNLSQFEPFVVLGAAPVYNFSDILFSRSTDGGATWSPATRVNDDPVSSPVDQFQPGIAVDKAGIIGVMFYDRRRDSRNFLIDGFFAASLNGGHSWINRRITKNNFPAIHFNDAVVNSLYMGDYVAVAEDREKDHFGFIVSFGENSKGDPNVVRERFVFP